MAFPDWLTSFVDGAKSLGSSFKPNAQSANLLTDPYYRFQSIAEVKAAARLGIRIDVNRATVDDWLRLPGISIRQAHALADLTKAGVHFYGLDDLMAVLNCSLQQLKALEPILSFCYYDPESLQTVSAIPVNTASVELLTKVPAIDLFLARTIVADRQSLGAYKNLADLQKRLKLPPTLTADLLYYLKF